VAESFEFVKEPVAAPSAAAVPAAPFRTIYIHLESKESIAALSFVLDQPLQETPRDIFYPESSDISSVVLPDWTFDNNDDQLSLYEYASKPWWHQYWKGMPEFISEDLTPFRTYRVHCKNQADVDALSAAVDQEFTPLTKWIWYPDVEIQKVSDKRWVSNL
jgi:hypothetical protein